MKIQGIRSAKSKYEAYKRNNAPAPDPEPVPVHQSQPGPDGTIWCCGSRSSPAAHALHLKGERLAMSCDGVVVVDLSDPWLAEQDARLKARRAETTDNDAVILRAEQVALYFEEQARPRRVARKVEGTSDWMTED
jgi:hypothetical protein